VDFRVEHKYLVPERLRGALRTAIQPFVRPDSHATPRAEHDGFPGYTVRSIYYDTSRFANYYANESGLAVRAKPRIRGYDMAAADAVVFLEVKRRQGLVGAKPRAAVAYRDVPDLLATGDIDRLVPGVRSRPGTRQDAEQFLHRYRRYALQPVVLVTYDREPYVGAIESSLRVTFDCHIRSRAFPELSGLYADRGLRHSLAGHFILEIKYDARLGFPVFFRPFLATHGIVRTALSKYFICLTDHGVVQPHARTGALARAEWHHAAFGQRHPVGMRLVRTR
jgi:hypothetical protein